VKAKIMDSERLNAIVAAILTAGSVEGNATPVRMVIKYREVLDALREGGGALTGSGVEVVDADRAPITILG
jgi:hypothetical protein